MNHHPLASTMRLPRAAITHYTLISIGTLVLFTLLVVGVGAKATHAATGTPCHTITSLTDAIPPQYASPLNFFTSPIAPMLTVDCDPAGGGTVSVQSSNSPTYIYQYGFHRVDGTWKRLTFSGPVRSGPWIMQNASAPITELVAGEGKVIAYVCQYLQGRWKCGCKDAACTTPGWQLQRYTTAPAAIGVGAMPNMAMFGDIFASATEPGIYRLSQNIADPGTSLTLSGVGFSSTNNTVLLNGKVVLSGIPSLSTKILSFSLPTSVSPGKYTLTVRAESKTLPGTVSIWVREKDAPVPTITSITPSVGKQGDTFTIHGSGFSQSYNEISTSFAIYDGVVSRDGTSLSFTFKPFDKNVVFRNMDGGVANYVQEVTATVITSGGASAPATFNVEM